MNSSTPLEPAETAVVLPPASTIGRWDRIERWLMACGERLNPILVKEARQSLKSKQFLVTFSLLLAFGWVWSLIGVAFLSPGIYFAPGGRFMLSGYFLILAAPVLVVIPFSAFRSLAGEREDGTFELLSITALNSRQIVTGKLGSSMLQMLLYYSALSPCVVFTYMLRGVDIFTIFFILAATVLTSVLLSTAGLLLATATRARNWQVVVSVLFLVGLVFIMLVWSSIMLQLIFSGIRAAVEEPYFWQSALAVLTFHVTFVALFVFTAAGQLSFASDNRSTTMRCVLLSQQVLWVGWMTFAWLKVEQDELLLVFVSMAAAYWFIIGAFLSAEYAELSPRVKRSLPQSFLGRVCLTWFNPGSGTGYTFATVNLFSICLIAITLGTIGSMTGFRGGPSDVAFFVFIGMCFGYVATYLGIGRLLLLLARRYVRIGVVAAFLMQSGLAVAGVAIPAFFQAWFQGYQNLTYTDLQATNWLWTLVQTINNNLLLFPAVPILVGTGALVTVVLNLAFAMAEVAQVRLTTPARVLEDRARPQQAKL
jgi:hypothetical protein